MCNCNRRHKAVTSAAMAALRANMTAEERAIESASAAIENAGGFIPASEPVAETTPEPVKTHTAKTTVKTTVKSATKKA